MPDTPPDPVATVDRCAELSALLDDPFADRSAVLRAAGLDEKSWAAIQERWVAMLAAAESDALVGRYGEVYETTLRRLASGGAPARPAPDTDREGPAFLSKEAQPWRAEAAAVAASGTGRSAGAPLSAFTRASASFSCAAARAPRCESARRHHRRGPGAMRPALPLAERRDAIPTPFAAASLASPAPRSPDDSISVALDPSRTPRRRPALSPEDAVMPLNVTVSFPSSADASAVVASGLKVRRYELRETMSELFELTLEVLSTEPAIAERAIAGQAAVAGFGDEPFVTQVSGIVRQVEQRTAVPTGDSLYAWTVVPPLWLTTRRRDHRIFQDMSVPAIVEAVLAGYGGRIPAPATLLGDHLPREYVVQYAETDWAFLSRILADEGIASFFDHGAGSAWTLIDDTAASAPDKTSGAIPFRDPSVMNDLGAPHVQTAILRSAVETSAVTLRDYDFEKPAFELGAKRASDGEAFANESPLEAYTFEVGAFTREAPGDARAARVLEADRAARRRVLCTASFMLPPGTRMSMVDHPRDDLDADFLVVRGSTIVDADHERTHELELMDLGQRFRPALRPKARIHGTQTAFVMSANGEEIDVDTYGRVLVQHRWDRRDAQSGATSRRVRVSQGWAGAGYGLVTLPRQGDEVIVAYLDGDPDQPLVVGRVHNALSTTPLNLPGEKTRSIWKSRSTPGGDGFNAIVMEDAAGSELLSLKAQRDYQSNVGNNASTVVAGDETRQIAGNQKITVGGDHQASIGGTRRIGIKGPQFVDAADTTINGKKIDVTATDVTVDADTLDVGASDIHLHSDGTITLSASHIVLETKGSSIEMTAGTIVLKSPLIELNP